VKEEIAYIGGMPNFFRELPDIRENKAYLYGWLAGYFAADGHIDKRGSVMINSSKKEDMLFVQDVCGVLGIACGEIDSQTVISNLTNKEHTMYKVFIHGNHLSNDFFSLRNIERDLLKQTYHQVDGMLKV
jgi:DNA primase